MIITAGVEGDIKTALRMINERLGQQNHSEWLKKIEEYKEKYPLKYHHDILTGPFIVEEIYRQTNGDAIISTEVGQNQMWAAQYYKFTKPRTLLTPADWAPWDMVLELQWAQRSAVRRRLWSTLRETAASV